MEAIDNVLGNLMAAIDANIRELAETKDLGRRREQSEVIKNLCESMGVFLNAMNNNDMSAADWDEDDDDDDEGDRLPF